MNSKRITAYLIGCIAFVLPVLAYLEFISLLGFPDGFITELEYVERRLARIFIGVSVILGIHFFYLGGVATRKEIGKPLLVTIVLYLILILSIFLIHYYYYYYLNISDRTVG